MFRRSNRTIYVNEAPETKERPKKRRDEIALSWAAIRELLGAIYSWQVRTLNLEHSGRQKPDRILPRGALGEEKLDPACCGDCSDGSEIETLADPQGSEEEEHEHDAW